MKTFSEACEATFMRTVPKGTELPPEVVSQWGNEIERWTSVHKEVQSSLEAVAFTCSLMQHAQEEETPVEKLLMMAFSHGVVVGIEMERPDVRGLGSMLASMLNEESPFPFQKQYNAAVNPPSVRRWKKPSLWRVLADWWHSR